MNGFYESWLRWRALRRSIRSGRAYDRAHDFTDLGDRLAGQAKALLDRAAAMARSRKAKASGAVATDLVERQP